MIITQESVNAFLQQNMQLLKQQYDAVAHLGRGAFVILPENVALTGDETALGNLDGESVAIFLNKDALSNLLPQEIADALAKMIDRYNPDTQLCFAFGDDEGNWILNIIRVVDPENN